MDCEDLLEEKLGDYLDGEAREELCRTIEEHLARCPDCQMTVDKTRMTIKLYREADLKFEIPIPTSQRLQKSLDREYKHVGGAEEGAATD